MYLPEELVVEILSRLPAASQARFQSISKRWNDLIKKEVRLAKKSLILMLIDSMVYSASVDLHGIHREVVKVTTTNQFSLKDPLSESSEEVDISKVFHCDGLLLCTTKDYRLVVWNPRSGETSWIKPRNSYTVSDIYALGKSSCNQYKILMINKVSVWGTLVDYEIYDFTSNSWRVTVGETGDWVLLPQWSRGMSVDGNTYWLAHSLNEFNWEDFLLSFDFAKERFGRVSLPGDHHSNHVYGLSVTREEQQLCLLTSQSVVVFNIIDLWRATKIESSGSMSWSKFLSVDLACLHHPSRLLCGMDFLADRENKVLVYRCKHKDSNSFFLHIVGEDKCIQVDGHDPGSKCSLLFSYVPTLVQIQQGSSLGVSARKASITWVLVAIVTLASLFMHYLSNSS